MAFECNKCWLSPCECGEQYKNMTVYQLEKLRKILNDVIRNRVYADYKRDQSWEGPGNR
jgi:hypothetical protein